MNPEPHPHFFLNFTFLRVRACSVADPHHLDADPDPSCLFDPDPAPACHFDADPDPTFHFDADPESFLQIKAQNLEKVFKQAHIILLACHLEIDADPDAGSLSL